MELPLGNLAPNQRYLVGVSGGRDSVALLDALVRQGFRRLVVCHLEHGLRGRAGREDARFVERLALKLKLPAVVASEQVAARAAATQQSIETAARHARFEFFARVARRRRCHHVLLAHHADDQVETFLLNLFRGAASAGLAAMRSESVQQIGAITLTIYRPLLGIWRAQIDEYIREHRLRFRDDASNAQPVAARNRLRHRIIPVIEAEMGREIREPLWRAATLAADDHDWMESLVPAALAGRAELPVAELRVLPRALQRRIIFAWLKQRKTRDAGFREVELVRGLLVSDAPAKINLRDRVHVRRRAGRIFIDRTKSPL